MTNESLHAREEKQRTDDAWAKFQSRSAGEPMHPNWAVWSEADALVAKSRPRAATIDEASASAPHAEQAEAPAAIQPPGLESPPRRLSRPPRGRRKWAALAAAGVLFGALLATPAGDRALASILAQFRMQDVTVVNEDDLQQLFNQFVSDGQTRESINRFGSFASTNGTISGSYEPKEAARLLGYPGLPQGLEAELSGSGTAQGRQSAYVSASQRVTFSLNVAPINEALKRLGAKKLLSPAVDGKPITLSIPEAVSYRLPGKGAAELRQMNVPVVTVDPSIDVKQALDAVLDFPLLPSRLKQSLQQSRILSGDIPMPVFAGQGAVQREIGGVKVIVQKVVYGDQTQYQATWVKDGQMLTFEGGRDYDTEEAFDGKLKEWLGA
ncbi:hypothetical protein [Cohnella nanjingensis]|uniref:DUF4367 domain-containing protein n=1 Tax=Cohnella nanjingensis TaxID=1387779 RepID=A0A7X0VFZ2_9BACL|nr:hypothetical protein [Cohnella nanjingensis]MBB6672580.1 hypothetical protein [Cohnella nanjingensis]